MPRSPDFLLGFGFTSKDKGLLQYLKKVKQGLTDVQKGFEGVQKTSTEATAGKDSVAAGMKTVKQASTTSTSTATKKYQRQFQRNIPLKGKKSFSSQIKDFAEGAKGTKDISRLARVIDTLGKRYQRTGNGLKALQKLSDKYYKTLKKESDGGALRKLTDRIENYVEGVYRWLGMNEHLAKFLAKGLPKAIAITAKGFVGLFKASKKVGGWLMNPKKALAGIKKFASFLNPKKLIQHFFKKKNQFWGDLFFRREDIAQVAQGTEKVGDTAEEVLSKVKKKLAKFDIGGTIVRSVQEAMRRTKVIIEKANLKHKLDKEFVKAKERVDAQLDKMKSGVKRAFGKGGVGGVLQSASGKIGAALTKMGKRFARFSDDATENMRDLIPAMREAALAVRSSTDGMWSSLKQTGKATFDGVIKDKEKFVRKFDENFRTLASKTETNLGRIGTEASQQFAKMSSAARTSFESMGEKLERSISESMRSARRDVGVAQAEVVGRARRMKKPKSEGEKGNLVMAQQMSRSEEMAQRLMDFMRSKSEDSGKAEIVGKVPQMEPGALQELIDAVRTLDSHLVSKVGGVESAIFKSAPGKGFLQPFGGGKGEEGGGGGIMDVAKFIPQLRGLGFLKGLMK